MQAHDLYFSTCSCVMHADPAERSTWSDLYQLLPCLRQAVSCNVCGNILSAPKGPSHRVCQHFVCSACVGGKMRLRSPCSWCKDHAEYTENRQLRIIVLCFKKLCKYILSTPIGDEIMSQSSNGETNNLMRIFQEALDIEDDYEAPAGMMSLMPVHPSSDRRNGRGKGKQRAKNPPPVTGHTPAENSSSPHTETDGRSGGAAFHLNGSEPHSSNASSQSDSMITDNAPKPSTSGVRRHSSRWNKKETKALPQRRTRNVSTDGSTADHEMERRSDVHSSPDRTSPDRPSKRTRLASSSSSQQGDTGLRRKTCRCAKTAQPSVLTCMGQRCPCYSSKLACVGCQCRGCRNPCTNEEELHHLSDSSGALS